MKTNSDRGDRPTRSRTRERARGRTSVLCAYCHDDLSLEERRFCASCLAPHHAECWIEHGLCSAPGCGQVRVLRPELPEAEAPLAPERRSREKKPGKQKPGRQQKRGRQQQGRKRQRRAPDALAQRIDEQAHLALVLGVVSLCACGLAAPFALKASSEASRLARRARVPVPGGATVGYVGGGIGLAGLALALLAVLAQVALL